MLTSYGTTPPALPCCWIVWENHMAALGRWTESMLRRVDGGRLQQLSRPVHWVCLRTSDPPGWRADSADDQLLIRFAAFSASTAERSVMFVWTRVLDSIQRSKAQGFLLETHTRTLVTFVGDRFGIFYFFCSFVSSHLTWFPNLFSHNDIYHGPLDISAWHKSRKNMLCGIS